MSPSYRPVTPDGASVAPLIDHTLLKSDSPPSAIHALCEEAAYYGFAAVCVHPCWLTAALADLRGSRVRTATVIGFPMGMNTSRTKQREADEAVSLGAQELDMVINVALLKAGELGLVEADIMGVVNAAAGVPVKVIIETCLLTDSEKVSACMLSKNAGAAYVKTSTGLAGGGATAEDVALMRKTVGPNVGVKASGGIRTLANAKAMIAAGANRIGTSAGVAIVTS
jgi:deoxyribose-phosphate aldolase